MLKLKRGSKSGLKYFTIADLKSWNLSYDLSKHLPEDFKGTAVDILRHENIPFENKLRVVLRPDLCSEKLIRLFAVYCYRDTLNWIKNPDPRSIEAANVAERYANGKATKEELLVAESAAWSAVESAARSTSWSAAWSAESAARSAESAARSAAWSAAQLAVESAAWSARSAAQERYISKLIEMLKVEGKEKVKK